jgi:hypothetical protein
VSQAAPTRKSFLENDISIAAMSSFWSSDRLDLNVCNSVQKAGHLVGLEKPIVKISER